MLGAVCVSGRAGLISFRENSGARRREPGDRIVRCWRCLATSAVDFVSQSVEIAGGWGPDGASGADQGVRPPDRSHGFDILCPPITTPARMGVRKHPTPALTVLRKK